MSRNKSLFLVGVFFLIVIIFGNIFWRMFSRGNNEEFDRIKKEAEINLAKKQTASSVAPASATPAVSGASAGKASEGGMGAPNEMQRVAPENPGPASEEAKKSTDTTSEKTQDDTADWKTYADEKNRFEFKYSDSTTVVPNGDLIRVSQSDKTWKFRVYSNKDKTDLQAWYNAEFSEKERTNCTLTDSTLKVGSYETKYVNPNSGATACGKAGYFSLGTDKKNVIRVELGEETVENVNKILATFKFKD